jgi:hypothetical protein
VQFVQRVLCHKKYKLRPGDVVVASDGSRHVVDDPLTWTHEGWRIISDWRSIPYGDGDGLWIDIGEYPSIRIRITTPDFSMILDTSVSGIMRDKTLPHDLRFLIKNSCVSGKVWRWVGYLQFDNPLDRMLKRSVLVLEDPGYAC